VNGNTKYLLIWMIRLGTVLFMFGMTCIIAYTWFGAYFNGDRILVTINDIGERDAELLLWIFGSPVLIYGTYLIITDIWKEGWMIRKRLRKLIRGNEDATEWL